MDSWLETALRLGFDFTRSLFLVRFPHRQASAYGTCQYAEWLRRYTADHSEAAFTECETWIGSSRCDDLARVQRAKGTV